jgi:hypothetical protein
LRWWQGLLAAAVAAPATALGVAVYLVWASWPFHPFPVGDLVYIHLSATLCTDEMTAYGRFLTVIEDAVLHQGRVDRAHIRVLPKSAACLPWVESDLPATAHIVKASLLPPHIYQIRGRKNGPAYWVSPLDIW